MKSIVGGWLLLVVCANVLKNCYCSSVSAHQMQGKKFWWSAFHERFLKRVGRPAALHYTLTADHWPSGTECYDLRRKILVMAHLTKNYANTKDVLLTAVRLDNALGSQRAPMNDMRCPIDAKWDAYDGWPSDLNVTLHVPGEMAKKIILPAISGADSITVRAKIPGLSSLQYNGAIQRNFFWSARDNETHQVPVNAKLVSLVRVQHHGWRYYDIPLDSLAVIVERIAGSAVRKALDGLQPNAYKADLARLVLLYGMGGVWLDTKMTPLGPLDPVLPKQGGMLPWDIGHGGIFNAFMALPRGDPLALDGIKRIMHNVIHRQYGASWLHVSGPGMLKDVMDERGYLKLPAKYHMPWILSPGGVVLQDIATGRPVMNVLNVEYRRKSVSMNDKCHYGNLWRCHAVFYEKLCDPARGVVYQRS